MPNNFQTNRPVPTVIRDGGGGDRSPQRQMGGLWQPTGLAFLTNDLTVFDDQELCANAGVPPNTFATNPILDGSNSRIGEILRHDSPGVSVIGEVYQPIVWVTPDAGQEALFGFPYHNAVPEASLHGNLPVIMLTDTVPFHGVVTGMARVGYPHRCGAGDTTNVDVAVVRVPATVVTLFKLGAPVVLQANPEQLVGLAIDMQPDATGTDFFVYPAARF